MTVKRMFKVMEVKDEDLAENKIDDRAVIFEISHELSNNEWLITKIYIDSRSSDALAIAVKGNGDAPGDRVAIYVDEDVLERGGVNLDKITGKPVDEKTEPQANQEEKPVIDEEMKKKASAFYDYINKIDLDDFGKHRS